MTLPLVAIAAIGMLVLSRQWGNDEPSGQSSPLGEIVETSAVPASESKFLLAKMPEGDVFTPTKVKELGGETVSTVLAGRIQAGDVDPFQPDQVAFLISEVPDLKFADDPDHVDNCPFCKRALAKAPKAIVRFRGKDGEILSGDARAILGLSKGDVVYVTGTAHFNDAINTVIMEATSLYRLPAKGS